MITFILGKSLSLPDKPNSSSGQNEKRSSSHFQPVERGIPGNKKYWVWGIRGAIISALLADGIYLYKTTSGKKPNGDATNTSIPTGTARRNERSFGRGLPMDISGEPHPRSRLQHP